jgi:hypothetical protein
MSNQVEVKYSDFYNLLGDRFNIEAVCPDYRPDSQCWATWWRDERGVAIVSGYDPEEDLDNHWLCHCGNYITHGGRCSCGNEPPWGADDGEDWEDDDLDFGFFDDVEAARIRGEDFILEGWDTWDDEPDYWLPGDLL